MAHGHVQHTYAKGGTKMQIQLEVSKETASYVKGIIDMINNFDAEVFNDLHSASKQIEQAIENGDKIESVEEMCCKLVDIFSNHSESDYNDISSYMTDNEELFQLWHDLLDNVGEAMGPFCYASFKLERYISEAEDDEVIGTLITPQTVRDCVTFYENHWRF